jgi:hypothetical protein
MNSRLAACHCFLSDRYELYRLCEACALAGKSQSEATGLTKQFPAWICLEIDKGLTEYRRWYLNRFEAVTKKGKPKYRSLADVLGITEERNRGNMSHEELTAKSTNLRMAMIEAMQSGQEFDISKYLTKPLES